MKYQIRGLLKFAEEDSFKNGCDPDTCQTSEVGVNFTGETPNEVISKVCDFLGVDDGGENDAVSRNACEEPGRVDFQRTENAEGEKMRGGQLSLWKRGRIKAWAATYIGYVEKVERVAL